MKRLFQKIFGFLGIGYGWCGGCSDPDCMDCQIEWSDESRRDAFEREVLGDRPTCAITRTTHCHLQGVRRNAKPCEDECALAPAKPSGIGHSVYGSDIEPVEYDGFGAPIYPYFDGDGQ